MISSIRNKIFTAFSLTFFYAVESWAQVPDGRLPNAGGASGEPVEDETWWYATIFMLSLGLAAALVWWYKTKKVAEKEAALAAKKTARPKSKISDQNAVDADREMEWYRKNQKSVGKKDVNRMPKKSANAAKAASGAAANQNSPDAGAEKVGEVRVWKFEELPISSFTQLKPAASYDLLPLSNDSDLMSAIEQTHEEFEEDEEIRSLSLRILAAFKTRNAAEALGQIALYDVSSNLRSKAVMTLADFDHESVFENVLLACADPTREVRAAAARGLFRLSFDRADAWTRIAESHDEFRMKQAARAAAEADLVERSFDRLIHPDRKVAYEAFALTALLVKAGESERIFVAIEKHRDQKVKFALLHVLNVVKDEETLPSLYALLEHNSISPEIKEKADRIIHSFELVPA